MAPKHRKGQSAEAPAKASKSSSRKGSEAAAATPAKGRGAVLSGVVLASAVGLLATGGGVFFSSKLPVEEKAAQAQAEPSRSDASTGSDDVGWDQEDGGLARLSSDLLGSGVDQTTLPGLEVRPTFVSASPRIFAFEDILSPEECRYLISLAKGRLKPAGVVMETTDKYKREEQWRNNEQIWITPQEERELPLLQHILKRMHRVARIPDTDSEALQIGRYLEGQKYEVHQDSDPVHDVMRPATMIVYLSDVEEGGETLFPKEEDCPAEWKVASDGSDKFGCALCCQEPRPGTVLVRPKVGRGVLFFNHEPDGQKDRGAVHAACPIVKGTKWIIQRWFRLKPYQNVMFRHDARFDGLPQFQTSARQSAGGWSGAVRVLRQKAPRIFLLDSFTSASDTESLKAVASWRLSSPEAEALGRVQVDLGDASNFDEVLSSVVKNLSIAAYLPGYTEALHFLRSGAAKRRLSTEGQHAIAWLFLGSPEASDDQSLGDLVLPLKSKCAASGGDCCAARAGQGEGLLRVPAAAGRVVLMYQDRASDVADGFLCPPKAPSSPPLFLLELRLSVRPAAELPAALQPTALADLTPASDALIL